MTRPFTIIFLLVLPFLVASQNGDPSKISPKLLERMEAAPLDWHSVHIVLADRVDMEALDAALYQRRASSAERARTVVEALREKARSAQEPLLRWLAAQPLVQKQSIRSYWIANAVFAKGKREAIETLSERPEVAWIGLNGSLQPTRTERLPSAPTWQPDGIEPGLAAINAPAMWELGYTGYGRLAFTNDTGVDPTHPAIAGKNAGLYRPVGETWFELDPNTLQPVVNPEVRDCQSHGTHVTGTMLGLDRLRDDTIGVAFNALWIGAPVLCGIGTEDNVAAFQWALDPDGNPNSTADIPDVINNSWFDPNLDGADCFSVYVPVVEAMEAAGIAVVFSAGNQGPDPGTISPPHNINLNIVNSFTVGAVNGNSSTLPIANFSSRGPSQCGGQGSLLIKPEVSAPGVSVRSCVPGNQYDLFSGTSMASPHVSGAILLLKEAFPDLPGKDLKLALYYTAVDLGQPGEDNTYGMGIIDVRAAFDYLIAQGHTPVSPTVATDVLLIGMEVPTWNCNSTLLPAITVENAGTDPLTSFDISWEMAGQQATQSWSGLLPPGERLSVALAPIPAPAGDFELAITLLQPNGLADERPLNNRLRQTVRVVGRTSLNAYISGETAWCENTPVLLRTEPRPNIAAGEGNYSVNWYDAPIGGNLLGTGPVFITPELGQPATFYAEASYTLFGGLADASQGAAVLTDIQNEGLVFDVDWAIRLEAVTIEVEETGGRFIQLIDSEGKTVAQKIVFPTQAGANEIELGWKVPAGKGYRLRKVGGKPLFANTSGANFPYAVDDVLRITGNTTGETDAWYFFYHWKISFLEPCGRTPVPVELLPFSTLANASFEVSEHELTLPANATVSFTNTTADPSGSFTWNFGDGTFSTAGNPQHTYTTAGIYVVSLQHLPDQACPAFALDTITVQEITVSSVDPSVSRLGGIALFPNPVGNVLQVLFELDAPETVHLRLLAPTGKLLYQHRTQVFRNILQVPLNEIPAGLYFLSVEKGGQVAVWKVVKTG